ncbi:hypothetical protein PV327_009980 [Microctonus hyperodae]|uniref:Uncharacterized protein n=1 Tax=Microctonus hyperodae TaxID=165561 RepID=A0AA39F247_MICHY|nr:hypothetical protein PV327_009980 [Microctonus hyperodae]
MDNRCRNPGIAEVTFQAYTQRHGDNEINGSTCWLSRAKKISLGVVYAIIISLTVYWLIIGPILESQGDNVKRDRNC